jgi:hypothetical protein
MIREGDGCSDILATGRKEAPVTSDEQVAQLRRIDSRMRAINEETVRRLVTTASDPASMARAYAAIDGDASGEDGRLSLRAALEADGLSDEQIDGIDALYVRCLLDSSLA